MALTGDTAALRLLVSQLATVGRVPRDARAELAKAALELVRDSFGAAASPEGAPWAPLKYRKGRPLVKTGRLLRSVRARAIGDGVLVTVGAPYAAVHQFGADLSARTNAHRSNGRFMSRAAAERRKRLVQVSFSKGGHIPARPFLPQNGSLPETWRAAFARVLEASMARHFKR